MKNWMIWRSHLELMARRLPESTSLRSLSTPQNWITWHQLLLTLETSWKPPNPANPIPISAKYTNSVKQSPGWNCPLWLLATLTLSQLDVYIVNYLWCGWILYFAFSVGFLTKYLEAVEQMWKYSQVKYERILRISVLIWTCWGVFWGYECWYNLWGWTLRIWVSIWTCWGEF